MLWQVATKALIYLITHRARQGLIKGIPLHELDVGQLVKGHFVDDYFLAIMEERS
jgi:hypothetical protein